MANTKKIKCYESIRALDEVHRELVYECVRVREKYAWEVEENEKRMIAFRKECEEELRKCEEKVRECEEEQKAALMKVYEKVLLNYLGESDEQETASEEEYEDLTSLDIHYITEYFDCTKEDVIKAVEGECTPNMRRALDEQSKSRQ